MKVVAAFVFVALAGLVVWLAVGGITGQSEPWDSGLFFTVGLPAMLLVSAAAGFAQPKFWWLWGIAVVSLQVVALFVGSEIGPMALVGLVTFGVLAALCDGGALVGSWLKSRYLSRR